MRWMPRFKVLKEHVKIYLDTEEREKERKEGMKERRKKWALPDFPKGGGKKNPETTLKNN